MLVTEPQEVIASHLVHPQRLGRWRRYHLETTRGGYSCDQPPMVRGPDNAPMALREELAIGSIVRLAVGDDGMLRAVQVMQAKWDDPFASAADQG